MTSRAIAFAELFPNVTVTPITDTVADDVVLVLFRYDGDAVSPLYIAQLETWWINLTAGTSLEGVRCGVLPKSIDVECVRVPRGAVAPLTTMVDWAGE